MPARDSLHGAVRTALERDGWTVTPDPYPVVSGRRQKWIDLGAPYDKPFLAKDDETAWTRKVVPAEAARRGSARGGGGEDAFVGAGHRLAGLDQAGVGRQPV